MPPLASYVLPIKSFSLDGMGELTAYLRTLRDVEVIVVDGSDPVIFAAHEQAWSGLGLHLRPDPNRSGLNGKVRGVLTGIAACRGEKVIIADDDVRYDAESLRAVIDALDTCDVVRPQNYFVPHAWHTLLDSGRILLNRVTGGDWPGTLGVRRAAVNAGYRADVLFENFELVQTVKARGGREHIAYGIFVGRRPPRVRHFLGQRVRQAYDEFARPARLATELCVLPMAVAALARHKAGFVLLGAAVIVAAAEAGRRRNGAARYFPVTASLAAPLWVLERGICAWIAVALRIRNGGVAYAGCVIRDAATPMRQLRKECAP